MYAVAVKTELKSTPKMKDFIISISYHKGAFLKY